MLKANSYTGKLEEVKEVKQILSYQLPKQKTAVSLNKVEHFKRLQTAYISNDIKNLCPHGNEYYCLMCLKDHEKAKEVNQTAKYKYDLREDYLYYDPNKSIGCDACLYELKRITYASLRKYAINKGFYVQESDLEDTLQQALSYVLRKPERWKKTIEKAQIESENLPVKAIFCRLARSHLKNLIKSYVRREEISVLDSLGLAPDRSELLTKVNTNENDFFRVEFTDLIRSKIKDNVTRRYMQLRLDGYKLREIADIYNVTEQSVYGRLCRASKAIQR